MHAALPGLDMIGIGGAALIEAGDLILRSVGEMS
jgi:hypothetical protein